MSLRYERKFKVDHLQAAHVREIIRAHPASFRPLFPDRTIHNIYYDTPGLTTHIHNLLGAGERRKFRVRWYGDAVEQVINPTLEIKRRLHLLGDKISYPVAVWDWSNLRPLTEEVRARVVDAPALLPQLYNSYRRSYLGTTDGKFRLTIDRALRFQPLALVAAARLPQALLRTAVREDGMVLELKYATEDDASVQRIMEHLPFRVTKKSKYATGMLATQ